MAKPEVFLEAPIPGQSLTATPKNYAWERPPQMVDYEEATKYYINKMADKESMDDLAVAFEAGLPISAFVEALLTTGVSEGLHSIDVSLIIAPVIHAFTKAAMLQYGIDAVDEVYDPDKDPDEREKRRLQTAIDVALAEAMADDRTPESDSGVAMLQEIKDNLNAETPEAEDMVEAEAMPTEEMQPPRRGLMAREGM
jgi:hypothetical protein